MKKIFVLISLVFTFTACAYSGGKQAEENKVPGMVEVTMIKFKFVPEVIEIKKGQTIRWVNKEKRQYHSVFFEKYGEEESDYIFPGESFDKLFDKKGEFDYRCGPHPEMVGKVIVK